MTHRGNRVRQKAARSRGRVRATAAIALVSLLALTLGAATASAEPLAMTFTEARANVGVQLADEALFGPPDTAPLAGQIDPASGSISAASLQVPRFSTYITDPVDADVAVDFEIGVITGGFSPATGGLSLSGTAGGTLTANGKECTVATVPPVLTLTTAGNNGGASQLPGAPFNHGLTGPGAIAGQWTDMTATPVGPGDTTVCETVDDRIGGPGGVWLAQAGDTAAPAAPRLTGTYPASPGASGRPRIRGEAEAGSTVRVYAGPGCGGAPLAAASAGELASPGIAVAVAAGVTAVFSATATDPAANISGCSAPISYRHKPACVVPNLAGKKLARAKAAVRAAGCTVASVHTPKRLRGKRRRALVVKSSNPPAGARPASGKVHLRLGPGPKSTAKRASDTDHT